MMSTDPLSLTCLCQSCSALDLRITDFGELSNQQSEHQGVILKQSLQAFKESTSCSLCRLVAYAVEDTRAEWQKGEKIPDPDVICKLQAIPYRFPTTKSFRVLDVSTNFPFFGPSYGMQLLPVESHGSDEQCIGRRIDPSSAFPIRLVKNWLQKCAEEHGDLCGLTKTPRFKEIESSLLLIDVDQGCIVDPTDEARYIALSYVWGQTKSITLVKENIHQLRQPGGLASILQAVSPVIRDTIEVTKRLGEKYIWIDSLCIVQDDIFAKSKIIHKMNLVYENAFLTIVAASGSDANSGLPGVHDTSRVFEQASAAINQDLQFVYPPAHDRLGTSVWASRGWTYQEYYFSKRRLIFYRGMLFFRCRRSSWREDIALERFAAAIPQFDIGLGFEARTELWEPPSTDNNDFWPIYLSYKNSAQAYMRRNLTWESDAANAFAGITDHIRIDKKLDTFWGLPELMFGVDMFWQPDMLMERRKNFPSWSWLGWKGSMWMGRNGDVDLNMQRQSLCSWIRWFRILRKENTVTYKMLPQGREVSKNLTSITERDELKEKSNSEHARKVLISLGSAWNELVEGGKDRKDYHHSKSVQEGLEILSSFTLPNFLHSNKHQTIWDLDETLQSKSLFFRTLCAEVYISACAPDGEIPQFQKTSGQIGHKAGRPAAYVYSTKEPSLEPLGLAWLNDAAVWHDLLAKCTSTTSSFLQSSLSPPKMIKEQYMPVTFPGDPQKFIFNRKTKEETTTDPQDSPEPSATSSKSTAQEAKIRETKAMLERIAQKPSDTLTSLPDIPHERERLLQGRRIYKSKIAILSGPVEGDHGSRVGVPFSFPYTTFRGFFRIMLLKEIVIEGVSGEPCVVCERLGIGELELGTLDGVGEMRFQDIVLV